MKNFNIHKSVMVQNIAHWIVGGTVAITAVVVSKNPKWGYLLIVPLLGTMSSSESSTASNTDNKEE